jgi:hypothetical protein
MAKPGSPIHFGVRVGDEETAKELEEFLRDRGATDLTVREEQGFLPIALPFVVVGIVAAAVLFDFFTRWRQTHACLLVIDARGDNVKSEVNCDDKNGRIIVITSDGTQAEIENVPPGVDLTELGKAAVSGAFDAVKAAADALGGTARRLPADDS